MGGLSAQRTDAALAELAGLHLIIETGDGRYRRHDLIGLYATECARLDEETSTRTETITRLLDWYLAIAEIANRTLSATHKVAEVDRRVLVGSHTPDPFVASNADADA